MSSVLFSDAWGFSLIGLGSEYNSTEPPARIDPRPGGTESQPTVLSWEVAVSELAWIAGKRASGQSWVA
jgi:hypothetical protein